MGTKFKIAYYLEERSSEKKTWNLMEKEFETFEEAEGLIKTILKQFEGTGINKKYEFKLIIIKI